MGFEISLMVFNVARARLPFFKIVIHLAKNNLLVVAEL
jgi:hypothetical protein